MANQITWRNIEAPDLSRAAAGVARSGEGMLNAFDRIGDTLGNYNKGLKEQATNKFMDQMAQIRTPEAMQSAIDSGAVDQLRQQGGYLLDPSTRGAAEERLQQLYQQGKAAGEYTDFNDERSQRGDFTRSILAATQGNYQPGNDFLAANPNAVKGADLVSKMFDTRLSNNQDTRSSNADRRAAAEASFSQSMRGASNSRAAEEHNARMGDVTSARNLAKLERAAQTAAWEHKQSGSGASDTEAQNKFFEDSVKSGLMTPDQAQVLSSREYFNSSQPLVGLDRIKADNDRAIQAAEDADFKANNAAAMGSRDALNNLGSVTEYIDLVTPDETERDKLKTMAARISIKGFTDPNGVRHEIPEYVIKSAIQSSRDPSMFNFKTGDVFRNTRHKDAETRVMDMMKDPQTLENMANNYKSGRRILGILPPKGYR